jgi:hypothetical protein
MQQAMLCVVPVKQHGMKGPPDARLVPANTAASPVSTVVTPIRRRANFLNFRLLGYSLPPEAATRTDRAAIHGRCPDKEGKDSRFREARSEDRRHVQLFGLGEAAVEARERRGAVGHLELAVGVL